MPSRKKKVTKVQSKRKNEDNDFDLHDIDSDEFEEPIKRSRLDDEDADIMFNGKRNVIPEEDYRDARGSLHKIEGKDEDAGLGIRDEEELEAAMEEQQKQLSSMNEDDFLPSDLSIPIAGKKKKKSSKEDLSALSKFLERAEDQIISEKVAVDYASLTADAKERLIKQEFPEVASMIADFKDKLDHVKSVLSPVIDKVHNNQLPTNDGVGFLELKLHLFITYLMNLSFYLLLKAEGKPVKDNPVVKKLIELRAYIDKLKPIEKKLQYQISRLLSKAALQESGGADTSTDRANLSALADVDENEGDVYSAPKGTTRVVDKASKKAREEHIASISGKKRQDLEEGMMKRALGKSKTENLTTEEGFGEIDQGIRGTLLDNKGGLMSKVKQGFRVLDDNFSDAEEEDLEESSEDDLPSDDEDEEQSENSDEERAKEFYMEELARKSAAKKSKLRMADASRQERKSEKKPEAFGRLEGELVDGHRKISQEITTNRGLVPTRNKKFKNPRVKSKYRAEKLATKVRSLVKPVKKPLTKYHGERNIRTDVIRSKKLAGS
eukprot:TRINITY_DN5678_c0_g1_i1.p1 TRINITY_DN5678_c0_g1~~TRINITY_DN5678_c0_g1_i1.p1  ORF type:complete len:551 (+),score=172.20 TRINITY_DN5678_c0_g1_i1:44-1696(+)